mgnify:CR=1 FL=1
MRLPRYALPLLALTVFAAAAGGRVLLEAHGALFADVLSEAATPAATTAAPQPATADGATRHTGRDMELASLRTSPDAIARSTPLTVAPPDEGDVAALREGLDALAAGNAPDALAVRDALTPGSLDRKLLTWAIAMSGQPGVSSAEIARAAAMLAGWPGMDTILSNAERALSTEPHSPDEIIAAFGTLEPRTINGAMRFARAWLDKGDNEKARAALTGLWRDTPLGADQERRVLSEFGDVLSRDDHRARMLDMLYRDRVRSAEMLGGTADARSLVKAWAAVVREAGDAAALIAAVDPAFKGWPAYAYLQARHHRQREEADKAAPFLLESEGQPESDAAADAWWKERRIVSRDLREAGKPELAYAVAANHGGGSPVVQAEAEFHAGWYALRDLNDPDKALIHFKKIETVTDGPISAARGAYWVGRALEAKQSPDARDHYERAAAYPTTFYGQLALLRLGEREPDLGEPEPTAEDEARFGLREPVRALRRLEQAGHGDLTRPIYMALAGELTAPEEIALLTKMAKAQDNHYLALKVAKRAGWERREIGALTHPLGAIPRETQLATNDTALAYAIARQESEFRVDARSGAGALGLLQVLPGTAKEVAERNGLAYAPEKLTTDAAYNATLGSHYLNEQIGRFGGSYILTFIAYNAGPRRVREWIERFGDPRGKPLDDVVDWIEQIPFTETRGYVQRVMENLQVYRMRLGEPLTIDADLTAGRPR